MIAERCTAARWRQAGSCAPLWALWGSCAPHRHSARHIIALDAPGAPLGGHHTAIRPNTGFQKPRPGVLYTPSHYGEEPAAQEHADGQALLPEWRRRGGGAGRPLQRARCLLPHRRVARGAASSAADGAAQVGGGHLAATAARRRCRPTDRACRSATMHSRAALLLCRAVQLGRLEEDAG